MKVIYDTDEIDNPNELGELLRDLVFGKYGFTETEIDDDNFKLINHFYDGAGVLTKHFKSRFEDFEIFIKHEGDTAVIFELDDGRMLENSNAKKRNNWEFIHEDAF